MSILHGQHFCDKRAAKNNKKHYIWQQVNILAIHVTEEVSLWFLKAFLMYPLSLQELGSDNTAYIFRSIYNLLIFNLLWFIVKRSKELSKLQCLWDFYILFHKLKRKQFFFLSYPAITDSRYYGRYIFPPRVSAITGVGCTEGFGLGNKNFLNSALKERFMNP